MSINDELGVALSLVVNEECMWNSHASELWHCSQCFIVTCHVHNLLDHIEVFIDCSDLEFLDLQAVSLNVLGVIGLLMNTRFCDFA